MTIQLSPHYYRMQETAEEALASVRRWCADHPTIDSDTDAAKAADAKAALIARVKEITEARDAERRPHAEAVKEINAAYGVLLTAVDEQKAAVISRLTAYLRRKEEELAAERRRAAEAARKAEEEARAAAVAAAAAEASISDRIEAFKAAAAAEAAAEEAKAVADRAGIKGRVATKSVSIRKYRKCVVADRVKATRWAWQTYPAEMQRLVEQLASGALRHGAPSVPGFDIIEEERAV